MQKRWQHLSCALGGGAGGIQRITQLKGWERMGYDVSKEIREVTGELHDAKKEKALKKAMEKLEAVQDHVTATMRSPLCCLSYLFPSFSSSLSLLTLL
jgi:hypothetical protein